MNLVGEGVTCSILLGLESPQSLLWAHCPAEVSVFNASYGVKHHRGGQTHFQTSV